MSDTSMDFIESLCGEYRRNNHIDPEYYERWGVKRGLRNADGTGVLAGVTQIGNVLGYYVQDGERYPMDGQLIYQGIDVRELIDGFMTEGRFGFEETAYLLLLGRLPTREQLDQFRQMISDHQALPPMFTEDVILRVPSPDVMNKLSRSILSLYSYDPNPDDLSLSNQLRQSVELIARVPVIVAHAFAAKRHYYNDESLYLHRPQPGLGLAENFLYSVRHDNRYTQQEARLLDLCLVLHAEHGGGNNSAFSCRVLSSSGTDIYSAISASVGALKGPRHGGANKKVMEMFGYLKEGVNDWKDDDEIAAFLARILRREAGDGSGLIYGMGHAIYTLSDPRAVLLKRFARELAETKGMMDQFQLLESVERLTPQVLRSVRGEKKVVCANVDLYSGLVYQMMGIPMELYTPLFAAARVAGWCAHRIEEVTSPANRIIRPAYKAVAPLRPFVPLAQRV
ncbi:citrate/2-methylcitrate synthase [Pseudoflavonifractor phocaeensis]|uniref:citrate/2-methylcitrate synthase n=1 Tax=Pseudoflavonifractor phocaeensis TaxID=1870988 RepID=UPI00195A642E|nr:citrate/2-methylcitrate synthase [Pseudoflavonifractor phocaeensis]MBM6870079.1 citrate/2-methylcitrate synthase [Pseudoflavonifractor phocaeensis]MBM6939125.1 citrate/2-methylcitrate synthase [Pseudoflavonifractor phocaeensis]